MRYVYEFPILICKCGKVFSKNNQSHHEKTKRHKEFFKNTKK